MDMNRRVFLDSSFWIVLRDEREPGHRQAQRLMQTLLAEKNSLVVTVLVFAETHAYFSKTPFRSRQILDDFENNPILISEPVSPADEKTAIALLRQQHDKNYSLCDAISFVVMRRLHIRQAATFDSRFRQFGEFEIIS